MENLLNQTAILKSKTGQSGYGTPTYAEGIPIRVRWEGYIEQMKDENGQEITSNARIFTTVPVKPDDILIYEGEEWVVVKILSIPGIDGTIHHWEVFV